MQPEQAVIHTAEIMQRQGVPYATSEDNASHRVIAGVAGIFVRFADSGGEDSIVSLVGAVLMEVDEARASEVLPVLNELNADSFYGKFVFKGGTIGIEYDMLGSEITDAGFMNTLNVLASYANEYAEQLKAQFGGRTYLEVENLNAAEFEAEG